MRASWILLTQGDRPAEVEAAVESIRGHSEPGDEIIVVANGCRLTGFEGVKVVELPENVGIPAGRNHGLRAASGDLLCFLDDDARLLGEDFVGRLKLYFEEDPRLGVVAFRITDTATGDSQRRHVPRIGNVDPGRSSAVTTFLGGACAIRTATVAAVGEYPERFFYALEETDLAWRALDGGWRLRYEASLEVHHPATVPSRHSDYLRRTARNRVWLARRRLPALLGLVYVCNWILLSVARGRSLAAVRQTLAGTREGLRTAAGPRQPISWSTALAMARMGRPPVI